MKLPYNVTVDHERVIKDSSNHSIPAKVDVSIPFPNPTNVPQKFLIQIPADAKVSSWVIPAISVNKSNKTSITFGNNLVYKNQGIIIRDICSEKNYGQGRYLFEWDTKDNEGNDVPQGFYRIYTQITDMLYWRDIYVFRGEYIYPEDIPL